jgi:hypothetical protein
MKKIAIAVAALAALTAQPTRAADTQQDHPFHVAPFVGGFVATGNQRDVLEDSVFTGITASYDLNPYLAVVGSFGWAPTKVKNLANSDLDLFQYDLGVQGQYALDAGYGLTLTPFVGLGVGARTYSFRDLSPSAETDFSGYVSAGATLQYRMVTFSATARDYISHYEGLGVYGGNSTHNDLALFGSVGVRF